jgi:NitT/TauT family transport system ATP-binding protein
MTDGTSKTRQDGFHVSVDGLTFSYSGSDIFRDFRFDSMARVTVFRGPSGCGKTTFLKLMYGLLRPAKVRTWQVPGPAYIVLQSDTLVPWFTGRENIQRFSPDLWSKFSTGPFFELVKPFIEKRSCEMSYGERRSIELARAFSANPPLLLLDEPFNFLDAAKRALFLDWINEGRECSSRIVLTSHYVEDVAITDADFFEFNGETPYGSLIERKPGRQ